MRSILSKESNKIIARLATVALFLLTESCTIFHHDQESKSPSDFSAGAKSDDPYQYLEDSSLPATQAWVAKESDLTRAKYVNAGEFQRLVQTFREVSSIGDDAEDVTAVGNRLFRLRRNQLHPIGVIETGDFPAALSSGNWDKVFDGDAASGIGDRKLRIQRYYCSPAPSTLCALLFSLSGSDDSVVKIYNYRQSIFIGPEYRGTTPTEVRWLSARAFAVVSDHDYRRSGDTRIDLVGLDSNDSPVKIAHHSIPARFVPESPGEVSPEGPQSALIHAGKESFALTESGTLIPLHIPADFRIIKVLSGEILASPKRPGPFANVSFPAGALVRLTYKDHMVTALKVIYQPPKDESLVSYQASPETVFAITDAAPHTRVRTVDLNSGVTKLVAVPPFSQLTYIGALGGSGQALWVAESPIMRQSWAMSEVLPEGDVATMKPVNAHQFATEKGYEILEWEVPASDGARIPIAILQKIGTQHPAPTILNVYGGFNVRNNRALARYGITGWMDRGGVLVYSTLRGDGGRGESWAEDGRKSGMARTIEDGTAIAWQLIAKGITTAPQLGIWGQSHGGLISAAIVTRNPTLFGAAVAERAVLDLPRFEQMGDAGPTWKWWYGDSKKAEDSKWLVRSNPYSSLAANTKYPAFLAYVAASDNRVNSGHSRKFVAKLKSARSEAWYFEAPGGGHIYSNRNELNETRAMVYSFFWDHLASTRREVH